MVYGLIVRPEAEADLSEAFGWYEMRREGLGAEFLLCVEASIASIQEHPQLYPKVRREARRALTRRFPYGVFYVLRGDLITVIAILDCRRDPRVLSEREHLVF